MTSSPHLSHLLKLAALTAPTLAVTALAQQTPSGAAPAVTGLPAPAQAQQIIERLSGQFSGRDAPTQVVYGAVPAALPANLAAPIDVLVSFRMVHGNTVLHRILLDRDATPDAALQAMGAQFAAAGWKAAYAYTRQAGFVSPQTEQYRKFYDVNPAGRAKSTPPT